MQHFFQNLFDYDFWANDTIIQNLVKAGNKSDESTRLMAHILGTEQVWLDRLDTGDSDSSMIWPEYDLSTCKFQVHELKNLWSAFVAKNAGGFLQVVRYHNSKGKQFENSIADILMHVVTHSSYHRGQISKLQRQTGEEPVNTDYVTYARAVK